MVGERSESIARTLFISHQQNNDRMKEKEWIHPDVYDEAK